MNTVRSAFGAVIQVSIYLVHGMQSSLGISVFAGLLTFQVVGWFGGSAKVASHLLTEVPGFPIQVVLGFAIGFVAARVIPYGLPKWAWCLPLAWFLFNAIHVKKDLVSTANYFFGTGCKSQHHCVDQVGITLPLLESCAYSLGAWAQQKSGK